MIRLNPEGEFLLIDNSAYIDPTTVITGKVKIGKKCICGSGCNVKSR